MNQNKQETKCFSQGLKLFLLHSSYMLQLQMDWNCFGTCRFNCGVLCSCVFNCTETHFIGRISWSFNYIRFTGNFFCCNVLLSLILSLVTFVIVVEFQTTSTIRGLVMCASELETYMVSVERVDDYCKVPSEVSHSTSLKD